MGLPAGLNAIILYHFVVHSQQGLGPLAGMGVRRRSWSQDGLASWQALINIIQGVIRVWAPLAGLVVAYHGHGKMSRDIKPPGEPDPQRATGHGVLTLRPALPFP